MPVATLPSGAPWHYDDLGRGQPLVLLHAFPLNRQQWKPQHDILSARVRLLAPDLPGFGETPVPVGEPSVDGMADAVAAWLEAIGATEPIVLGGLSMGGYVALAFARRHPAKLKGLILADTRAEADPPEAKTKRAEAIALVEAKGVPALFDGMLPKATSDRTRSESPNVIEELKAIAAMQSAAGTIAGLAMLRDRPDSTESLSSIVVPTLIIVGAEDATTPPALSKAMAAAIPNSTFIEIAGAGHFANAEAPAEFNEAILGWLKGIG